MHLALELLLLGTISVQVSGSARSTTRSGSESAHDQSQFNPNPNSNSNSNPNPNLSSDIYKDKLDSILRKGINQGLFPGAVAIVGSNKLLGSENNGHGLLYFSQLGHYTNYSTSPEMKSDTIFDMASCSKVVGTTSAIAWLYEHGMVRLEDKIVDILGPAYANNGKEEVTIKNCLLHNAGYNPDPDPW